MKTNKEDIIQIIILIAIGVIGLGLSILFIYAYETYNNIYITITTAIGSLIYMEAGIVIIQKSLDESVSKKFLIFAPIIYVAVVFLSIFFMSWQTLSQNPMQFVDFFLWAVYLMPSFLIALLLLLLFSLGA